MLDNRVFETNYDCAAKVHQKFTPSVILRLDSRIKYGTGSESSSFFWIARSSMPSTTIGGRAMTIVG
jgi:hypothetical protein